MRSTSILIMLDTAETIEDYKNILIEMKLRMHLGHIKYDIFCRYQEIIADKINALKELNDD